MKLLLILILFMHSSSLLASKKSHTVTNITEENHKEYRIYKETNWRTIDTISTKLSFPKTVNDYTFSRITLFNINDKDSLKLQFTPDFIDGIGSVNYSCQTDKCTSMRLIATYITHTSNKQKNIMISLNPELELSKCSQKGC
jgi:hypothetical protein